MPDTSKKAKKDPCSYGNANCCSRQQKGGRPGHEHACTKCDSGTYHEPCGKKFYRSVGVKNADSQFMLQLLCLACALEAREGACRLAAGRNHRNRMPLLCPRAARSRPPRARAECAQGRVVSNVTSAEGDVLDGNASPEQLGAALDAVAGGVDVEALDNAAAEAGLPPYSMYQKVTKRADELRLKFKGKDVTELLIGVNYGLPPQLHGIGCVCCCMLALFPVAVHAASSSSTIGALLAAVTCNKCLHSATPDTATAAQRAWCALLCRAAPRHAAAHKASDSVPDP